MILDAEDAFPYCDWSIKMNKIIWFSSMSVDLGTVYGNNWHRLSLLPYLVYVRIGKKIVPLA